MRDHPQDDIHMAAKTGTYDHSSRNWKRTVDGRVVYQTHQPRQVAKADHPQRQQDAHAIRREIERMKWDD